MSNSNTPKKKKSSVGPVFLAIVLIVGLYIVAEIVRPDEVKVPKFTTEQLDSILQETGLHYSKLSSDYTAYSFVKDNIEAGLKSPSTATWPPKTQWMSHVEEIDFQHFKVISHVDAQNSFGAVGRMNFSAEITFDGLGYKISEAITY